jgi:predicted negative regulator of RcsB-dependent stress response
VGTTKLTRKEILADDPIQEAMIRLVEFFRKNGLWIGIIAAALVVLGIGVYFGLNHLESRELEAQNQLAKGMDIFHAPISEEANDNSSEESSAPSFSSEEAKYQEAAKEFSAVASGWGHRKLSIIASYYLGLTQLKLGNEDEGIKNLESISANSTNRTLGFLAKKALAAHYLASGNYETAASLLDGIVKDPQCDLPKDDLNLNLARALAAQGKNDEAIIVLTEATSQYSTPGPFRQLMADELDKLQRATEMGTEPETTVP